MRVDGLDAGTLDPLANLHRRPVHCERVLGYICLPDAVSACNVLEDSVFAMLHALGHLDHTVVVIVVVPLCALRSIHLDWVGLVHLHERDARSGRVDGRRERNGVPRTDTGRGRH